MSHYYQDSGGFLPSFFLLFLSMNTKKTCSDRFLLCVNKCDILHKSTIFFTLQGRLKTLRFLFFLMTSLKIQSLLDICINSEFAKKQFWQVNSKRGWINLRIDIPRWSIGTSMLSTSMLVPSIPTVTSSNLFAEFICERGDHLSAVLPNWAKKTALFERKTAQFGNPVCLPKAPPPHTNPLAAAYNLPLPSQLLCAADRFVFSTDGRIVCCVLYIFVFTGI